MMDVPIPGPARRPAATLGGLMVVVATLALIFGAFRVGLLLGLLTAESGVLLGAVAVVARRTGLPRPRAAVAVLTAYAWVAAAVGAMQVALLAQFGRFSPDRGPLLGIALAAGFAVTLATPFAAAINLILSLALVVPVYYRGGSDREADAGTLLVRPLAAWTVALGSFFGAWGLMVGSLR